MAGLTGSGLFYPEEKKKNQPNCPQTDSEGNQPNLQELDGSTAEKMIWNTEQDFSSVNPPQESEGHQTLKSPCEAGLLSVQVLEAKTLYRFRFLTSYSSVSGPPAPPDHLDHRTRGAAGCTSPQVVRRIP